MISISCDWFIVWMGFLSFLISWLKLCHLDSHPPLPMSPLPNWYNLLQNTSGYPDPWLDGLSSSAHQLSVHSISGLCKLGSYFDGWIRMNVVLKLNGFTVIMCHSGLHGPAQKSRQLEGIIVSLTWNHLLKWSRRHWCYYSPLQIFLWQASSWKNTIGLATIPSPTRPSTSSSSSMHHHTSSNLLPLNSSSRLRPFSRQKPLHLRIWSHLVEARD